MSDPATASGRRPGSALPNRTMLALAPVLFVLLWSSGFVAAALAVPFAEPCTFLFLRFGIVVAVAGPLALLSKATWENGRGLAHAIVAGGLMQGLYLSCVVWSIYLGMPAGVVALTVSLHPITTAVLARLVLGERISWLGWIGFVLGVAGAALVLWPKLDLAASGVRPATIALCLLALPCMSCGTIYQKRYATGTGAVASTAAQHVGALLVVGAGATLLEVRSVDWTPVMIGALLWQAVAVSFGAVGLLLMMLRAQAASRAASVFYLIPAGSAAMTWALLGESLEPVQLAGVLTVTAAVFLIGSQHRSRWDAH
ncbi:MAG: DMT family transporter [Hyphomicrobiaceae bacterium]|nr:DMT family transporter [Hyphomicrobiaceae bacterium]